MAMLGSIANTCTPDIRTNRDFNQLLAVWSSCRQIFRICTVRYAEGLWRMRRHGPVIAHCTDSWKTFLFVYLTRSMVRMVRLRNRSSGVTEQLGDLWQIWAWGPHP